MLRIWMVPYYLTMLFYYVSRKEIPYDKGYRFLRKVSIQASKAGRVKIEVEGLENIPDENGYMIAPNHQGLFDVLAVLATSPNPVSVIYKKELDDIFCLKQILQLLHSIAIDRDDVKQSMSVIIEASKRVREGSNYLIFSEGTRSRELNKTGEFKAGSFKIAQKAKAAILPCALIDCYKPFDISSIKKETVYVKYLEPILYEEYQELSTAELANLVKERIDSAISLHEKNMGSSKG